jgi:hypothetical protein
MAIPNVLNFPFVIPFNQPSSPFNSQEQNTLKSFADALTSYSNVGQLTGNLYAAENTLENNGTNLPNLVPLLLGLNQQTTIINQPAATNSALADLINAESTLGKSGSSLSSFVSNILNLVNLSANLKAVGNDSILVANLSTLNSFLSSPNAFILSNLAPNLQKLNNDATLSANLSTLDTFLNGPSSFIYTNLPTSLQTLSGDSTLTANLTTLNNFLTNPSSFTQGFLGGILPNVFSNQSIAGTSVTSQQLIKDLINNSSSSPNLVNDIQSILRALLPGSMSSSNIQNSGITPSKLMNDMISNPNNLVVDFQSIIWNIGIPSSWQTFILSLFSKASINNSGVNPNKIVSDLFYNPNNITQDMQNIIWNGSYPSWTSFILSLFSTGIITSNFGSTKISPSTFMSDLMSLSSNLRADIGQLVIQGLDDGLYNLPYGPANKIYSGSPGINTWVNDLIGVGVNGGNPVPIISDFLNIGNIGNISGFNLSPGTGSFQFNVNPNFGIGNFLLGILTNISNIQTDLFIGTPIPVSSAHIDNIIIKPITGIYSGYSTTAVYPLNFQNMPPLPGRLGYILQAGWTAQSEMMYISSQDLSQLQSAINNLNPIGALNVLIDIVRRIIAALDYGGRGLQQLSLIVGQITSILANVGNFHNMPSLLGSSSLIPVSPPDFQSGLGYQLVVQTLQNQFASG